MVDHAAPSNSLRSAVGAVAPPVGPSPLYAPCILVLLGCLMAVKTVVFARGQGEVVDFDAFHIVGRMALHGQIAGVYHFPTLMKAEMRGGHPVFLAWSYPPQFALVTAVLARLPVGVAYLAFTGGGLAAYLWVLRRAAGERFSTALLMGIGPLLINVTIGQNGLLTGALMGAAVLGLARRDPKAGLPLGLMVIKPHLAATLAAQALAARRWGVVFVAGGAVAVTTILATAVFGSAVWPAFLKGAHEAAAFLQAGQNPLHRMVSIYAAMMTLGASATVSLALQGVAALAALAGVARLAATAPPARSAGFALLTATLVSPYAYDYDITIAVMGLAILLPDLQRWAKRWEAITVFALVSVAGLGGMAESAMASFAHFEISADQPPVSVGGPAMLAAAALVWRILGRAEASTRQNQPRDLNHARGASAENTISPSA